MYNLPTAAFMCTIFCTWNIKKLESLKCYTILTLNRSIFVNCTEHFATINDMKSGSSVFSYYNVDILIIMIKSMMRWAGHVARMGDE
jgi:hypothetical protein